MLGMTGKRLYWTGLLCLGMGLPLLFTLALAGLGVYSRVSAESLQDVGDRVPPAGDWAADTAATIKLTASRILTDGSTPEFSGLGPVPAAQPLAGSAIAKPLPWVAAVSAATVPPRFYRPQAPPFRV